MVNFYCVLKRNQNMLNAKHSECTMKTVWSFIEVTVSWCLSWKLMEF